ncbi:MAG: oligosaccharide flippase family protein [Thermaurantimonas sp.]|uniref:oligosaccharide flippase family protein n=1 Tax=Thermaurantimonas sp. TaxID=2681568 RepID=UPI00391A1899
MSKFVQGLNWTVIQQVAYFVANYVSLILLAKYLRPEDFGIVAVSTVLVGLFDILNGFGIPQLVIKNHVSDEKQLGHYYGKCLLLSAGLAVACIFGGQIYVLWYQSDIRQDVVLIISVSSLGLILNSTVAFYNALYQRVLDFKMPALYYTIGLFAGNVLAVIYASMKGGYWSLVLRNLATPAFVVLGFTLFSRFRIVPHLRSRLGDDERSFTFWLSSNQVLNYLSRNLDYLIIGRFFDVGVVGQYSIAYKIMLLPMKFLSSRIQSVLYPTLARMQDSTKALVNFYVKVVSFIGFISFPLMALASVTAPLWVPLLFDSERYVDLIHLIQWLTIAGAFQAVTAPIGSLYLVNNLVRQMAIYSIISAIAFTVGYLLGVWSGNIVTFAIIYTIMSIIVNFFVANHVPLSHLGYSLRIFLKKTLPPILPVMVAYLFVQFFLWSWEAEKHVNRLLALATLGIVFVLTYLIAYALLFRPDLHRKLSKLKTLYS